MDTTTFPLTDEWIKMWYIYTKEFYSAFKRNEVMPFAATLMDLEIIISQVRQRQISYGIVSMQNLKNDSNEPIYKPERDSQT